MHTFSNQIKEKMKDSLLKNKPDLLLYIDNPYLEELIDALIGVVANELADIRNEYVAKSELHHR